jgi:hypothetical protein
METEVAIIRKANTIMINKSLVTSKLLTEKRVSGSSGSIIFLTSSKDKIEGIAKLVPIFFKLPNLWWLNQS